MLLYVHTDAPPPARPRPAAAAPQLAKLLALSYGEQRLTQERWQGLMQMEHARACRLRVV